MTNNFIAQQMNFGFFVRLNFATLNISYLIYFLLFAMVIKTYVISAQSTCNFMLKIPRLKLHEIPSEPEFRNVLYKRDAEQISYCNPMLKSNLRTCCTAKIEAQMEKLSREDLEKNVKSQINLLKEFFHDYSVIFQSEFIIIHY